MVKEKEKEIKKEVDWMIFRFPDKKLRDMVVGLAKAEGYERVGDYLEMIIVDFLNRPNNRRK